MSSTLTRRDWLALCSTMPLASAASDTVLAGTKDVSPQVERPFRFSLNTSTIRGQKLKLPEEVDLVSEVGYNAIEPWIRELDEYVEAGGSLDDLKKRIEDRGLTVESSIGFFDWVVDDDARRKKGLEEARRSMELVRRIGGSRIAAPPAGATDVANLDLYRAAERYRALLELGDSVGVVPQVEVWGFSKSLSRLGEAALVAIEAGHPSACILADVYHLHKGGSSFEGLKLLSGAGMKVFHMNDYPASPARESITDADRVYPGDGVAPLGKILRSLRDCGFRGTLSLELFNPGYWEQDARLVARTGLEKMRAVVDEAFSGDPTTEPRADDGR